MLHHPSQSGEREYRIFEWLKANGLNMTSCLQKLFARVSGVRFISFFCSFFIARLPSSLTSSSSSWLLLLPSTFSSYHLAFHCYREKHNERKTSVPNFCINFPTTTTTTKKKKRVSAVPIFSCLSFSSSLSLGLLLPAQILEKLSLFHI